MSENNGKAAAPRRTTKAKAQTEKTTDEAYEEVFQEIEAGTRKLSAERSTQSGTGLERIREIPVQISVELGRRTMSVSELLDLGQGSVVELDALAGEPVNLRVNNHPVANGDIVTVDDKYGIRITEILTSSERIQKLRS